MDRSGRQPDKSDTSSGLLAAVRRKTRKRDEPNQQNQPVRDTHPRKEPAMKNRHLPAVLEHGQPTTIQPTSTHLQSPRRMFVLTVLCLIVTAWWLIVHLQYAVSNFAARTPSKNLLSFEDILWHFDHTLVNSSLPFQKDALSKVRYLTAGLDKVHQDRTALAVRENQLRKALDLLPEELEQQHINALYSEYTWTINIARNACDSTKYLATSTSQSLDALERFVGKTAEVQDQKRNNIASTWNRGLGWTRYLFQSGEVVIRSMEESEIRLRKVRDHIRDTRNSERSLEFELRRCTGYVNCLRKAQSLLKSDSTRLKVTVQQEFRDLVHRCREEGS